MKPIASENSAHSAGSFDHCKSTVYDCALVELPRRSGRTGNVTALLPGQTCPFKIQRTYYLYDVPGGSSRGGHAHRGLEQLIIAASGSFDVIIDDGQNRRTVMLNRPYYALHIVPGMWREICNFSSGSICLVMASAVYDEADYIRVYEEFLELKTCTPGFPRNEHGI